MKIMCSIPAHDGKVWIPLMDSLLASLMALAKEGITVQMDRQMFDADISHARNCMTYRFLESDCDVLWMLDSDLCFEPDVPVKLATSGHLIAAATYPMKKPQGPAQFSVSMVHEHGKFERDGRGFAKAHWCGAGMLMIRREVFKKLEGDEYKLACDPPLYTYWQSGIVDGRYKSEDTNFFDRCQKAGVSLWVLENCELGHWGSAMWSAHFGEWLKERSTSDVHGG